ncbi:DUF2254 domain-containing protein [Limnoglobus roseus]|uniref:Uncharacterized protein n=1 Tax=Limnoglobus roseus TaxID=2598579 RepID=A0A5C1ABL9_9BACT|nr:DUF2254 domain-containing protein [Limnoglobus roseus]QEL14428.1 hypothetical protein PX52LOC_01316 [Limnoglobus roseus]
MATVRLTKDQCQRDELPGLCARCGRPASTHIDRTFAWNPPWVGVFLLAGILPGVILLFATQRRLRVRLPMCERHLRHWRSPTTFTWIGLPVCLGIIVFGLFVLGEIHHGASPVANAGVFTFLAWIAVVGVWHSRLIRPERIDANGIVLTGVAEEFADAVEAMREESTPTRDYGEYDDEDRPARPRRNRYEGDD